MRCFWTSDSLAGRTAIGKGGGDEQPSPDDGLVLATAALLRPDLAALHAYHSIDRLSCAECGHRGPSHKLPKPLIVSADADKEGLAEDALPLHDNVLSPVQRYFADKQSEVIQILSGTSRCM